TAVLSSPVHIKSLQHCRLLCSSLSLVSSSRLWSLFRLASSRHFSATVGQIRLSDSSPSSSSRPLPSGWQSFWSWRLSVLYLWLVRCHSSRKILLAGLSGCCFLQSPWRYLLLVR